MDSGRVKVSLLLFSYTLLGCVIAADARGAQPRGGQPLPQPKPEAFEGEGAIELVAPGKLQIVNNANQRCMVVLTPQTKVELTGTATVDALRPGMGVRFTAAMDKQGVVKEKVAQLTIFTPSQENPLGFWSAAGEAGSYLIAGRVMSFHAGTGKLQLTTGNALVKAEVSADAQVDAKLSDYAFARKGDRITVTGQTIPKSGLVQAATVKITAAEPLGGGAKIKPGKPTKPAREPRTPKKSQ